MRLEFRLEKAIVPVRSFTVYRQLGGCYRVVAELIVQSAEVVGAVGAVAAANAEGLDGYASVWAADDGGSSTCLTAPSAVVDLRMVVGDDGRENLVATMEAYPQGAEDPFKRRFRVHKGKKLEDIVKSAASWLKLTGSARNCLASIKFAEPHPVEGEAYFLQDGLTDWEFVERLMASARICHKVPPIGISCRPNDEDVHEYELGLLSAKGVKKWGQALETVPKPTPDTRRLSIRGRSGANADWDGHSPKAPPVPLRVVSRSGAVKAEDAQKYLKTWLPLDEEGDCVVRTVDRFEGSAVLEDGVRWDSDRFVSTSADRGPQPAEPLGTIVVPGTVAEAKPTSPHISVNLDAYEGAPVVARLSPPFSGTQEKTGLHFCPYTGSVVWVVWSGRPGSPVMCGGNIRIEDVEHPSPFVGLEEKWTNVLSPVLVKNVDKITVESAVDATIQKAADVTIEDALTTTVKSDAKLESQEAGISMTAKDKIKVDSSDAGIAITGKEELKLTAKKIVGTADDSMKLEGGGKALKLKGGKADIK